MFILLIFLFIIYLFIYFNILSMKVGIFDIHYFGWFCSCNILFVIEKIRVQFVDKLIL